ncbi:unnamed protein product [Lampetra fluviatilis]
MAPLIYFCGSVRGGRGDAALYAALIGHLQSHGRVLTAHVGCQELGASGEANLDEAYIYRRDMEWLEQADVVVAEVTQPSLGVGYEIGRAVAMKKNILCLFRPSSGWGKTSDVCFNYSTRHRLFPRSRPISQVASLLLSYCSIVSHDPRDTGK